MNATHSKPIPQPHERIRLIGTPVGRMVRIDDFGDEIDPLQREQLHAYGLSAAHAVKVLQQQPMTVLLCEHVELAIEPAVPLKNCIPFSLYRARQPYTPLYKTTRQRAPYS